MENIRPIIGITMGDAKVFEKARSYVGHPELKIHAVKDVDDV